jgi:formylglycine-generating enzyme required for sulfatase activity
MSADRKAVRGGSFFDNPKHCRSDSRLDYPRWQRVFNVGFRVVCEAPSASPELPVAAARPR